MTEILSDRGRCWSIRLSATKNWQCLGCSRFRRSPCVEPEIFLYYEFCIYLFIGMFHNSCDARASVSRPGSPRPGHGLWDCHPPVRGIQPQFRLKFILLGVDNVDDLPHSPPTPRLHVPSSCPPPVNSSSDFQYLMLHEAFSPFDTFSFSMIVPRCLPDSLPP